MFVPEVRKVHSYDPRCLTKNLAHVAVFRPEVLHVLPLEQICEVAGKNSYLILFSTVKFTKALNLINYLITIYSYELVTFLCMLQVTTLEQVMNISARKK